MLATHTVDHHLIFTLTHFFIVSVLDRLSGGEKGHCEVSVSIQASIELTNAKVRELAFYL